MSRIVDFRQRVMDAIREHVPSLESIDWYDGLFDQQDIEQWSVRTPAAWVSITSVGTEHISTGEMNANLRCVVAIVDSDNLRPRDSDETVWTLMEQIAVLANMNRFGDENAAPAIAVKFQRIRDPELRREGTALAVVEWQSAVTIGRNTVHEREWVYYNGERVTQTPPNLTGHSKAYNKDNPDGSEENQSLPPDDDAFQGIGFEDRGVAEDPVPGKVWTPSE